MSRAAPLLLNWRQTTQSMSDTPKKFYLTTPIYYVNARPHIGHAYTTVVADVIARRHRLLGDDTFFLTGTDEHGQKIERSAIAAGIPPQQFADKVSASFRALWTRMGILDDSLSKDDPLLHRDFIRTTEPRHKQGVQRLFQQLRDNGYIYLSTYTGQYCVSDEAYVDGPPGIRCPDCGRTTETVSESNYYFKLSAFQRPLMELITSGPNGEPPQLSIQPESRRNEVLSFLQGNVNQAMEKITVNPQDYTTYLEESFGPLSKTDLGSITPVAPSWHFNYLRYVDPRTPYVPGALKDLSISRTSFKWGVPVPGDEAHVIYVWLDALANYMTAIGYGSDDPADIAKFERYWPADLHLVGKEIIRFHCVYWPAFLLALNPAANPPMAQPRRDMGGVADSAQATKPGGPSFAPSAKGGLSGEARPPSISPEDHRAWAKKMLPRAITAHGWLLFEESKMSKSRGNIVRTETILDTFGEDVYKKQFPDSTKADQDLFATDVLRYFLLREIPFGQDGSFSFDAMITRYNADLANGYGNLVSRTLSMIEKYGAGKVPTLSSKDLFDLHSGSIITGDLAYLLGARSRLADLGMRPEDRTLLQEWVGIPVTPPIAAEAEYALDTQDFGRSLERVLVLVSGVDGFITASAPWKLAKLGGREEQLSAVLYTAAESIRIITALLYPILPFATARVWAQLGLGSIEAAARNGDLRNLHWGGLQPGTKLGPLSPIFPRAVKGLAQTMAYLEQNSPALTAGHDATPTGKPDLPEAPLASAASTPAPSKLTTETTCTTPDTQMDPTHPAAPPRTSAIEEAHPIAQVAGSASTHTQLHKPPSHTEAFASGPFNTAQSSKPIAPSSIQNPAAAASIPGQQTAAASITPTERPASTTPTEGPASTTPTGGSASTTPTEGSASTTPTEGPGFSRADTSSAEGGTALPKAVLPSPAINTPGTAQITIDDFAKVELRVARILVCERIPKADKLLRLEVDLGPEPGMGRRQILSGIAQWYTPEELIGRKIIVIANLAPRKMRGLDSHGMLLAASTGEDGKPALATFAESDNIEPGARLK